MNIQRPSAGLIAALAVAGLTSAAFTPTGPNEGWASSSMRHRASEKFDYVLGQEKWQPLGDEISLFGQEFPVEMIGPVHFEIDSNGDGRVDRDIKGSDGFVDLKGENAEGQVFHYGVRFRNEGEREWSWTASGAMAGKVEGLTMAVIDANANGRYDDLGVDGLVIGKDRGAGYVSRIVNIDGKLFEFDINADGTEVRTRPYTGETGVLTLKKIKGIKASVVTAIARQGKDVSFQIAGAKKGVVVPVGDYVLADAFLEGGSETARIRMGRMEELEVATGAEVDIQLGGPLVGEVPTPRLQDGKAVVSPNVQVFGSLGEEYYDFQPKGKVPTFELYDANTGKRLKKGKFPAG
ncbi:MAG: hypothetical protein ACPGPE_12355 [Planctomycetota bacterium]